jgi:hypothetical protein
MDGLTLRKHIRVLLIRSLSWSHPLKCGTLISGCDLDLHVNGLAFRNLGRESDGKWAAIRFHSIANGELDALALDFYDRYVKEAEKN